MIAQARALLAFVALAALVGAVACQEQGEEVAKGMELAQRAPHNWALGLDVWWRNTARAFFARQLIRFNEFKAKFHKRYATPSEETLRHALYSERLLRVSMSVLRYFTRASDTFKSINSRSDMTKREREDLLARRPARILPPNEAEKLAADDEDDHDDHEDDHNDDNAGDEKEIGNDEKRSNDARRSDDEILLGSAGIIKLDGGQPRGLLRRRPLAPAISRTTGNGLSWFVNFAHPNLPGIDLRKTDCLAAPGDQGNCESCASFVAIAQMEFLRCREIGKLEKFSEQFPIDCGAPFGMMGCAGTDVHSVFKFISQVGLLPNASYPYVGRQRRCPYYRRNSRRYNFEPANTLKLRRPGLVSVHVKRWSKALEQNIPLHVGVLTNDDFEDYGGGIASSCANSAGAHGMLLVGEGREDGADYWLLRNSYGDWGDEGHYKLNKRATECLSDDEMGYHPLAFLDASGSSFVWSQDE